MSKVRHTTKKPWLIRKYMSFFGYRGLTTYWNTIYYVNAFDMNDEKLRKHELKHIEQMQRDGKIKHFFKYNYYWITKGYENNPYEIEAREAEDEE